MPNTQSHEPIILHLHADRRPETQQGRNQLIDKACTNLHLKSAACRLLKYYGNLNHGAYQDDRYVRGDGTPQHRAHVCTHPSDERKVLTKAALIYYEAYSYVKVDWQRIDLMARYINPRKAAAKIDQIETDKDDQPGGRSIIGCLKKADFKLGRLVGTQGGAIYTPFEAMSDIEFSHFLDHCAALFHASVSDQECGR